MTNSQLQKLSPDADPPNNSKEVYKTPRDTCRPNVCLFSARKKKEKEEREEPESGKESGVRFKPNPAG